MIALVSASAIGMAAATFFAVAPHGKSDAAVTHNLVVYEVDINQAPAGSIYISDVNNTATNWCANLNSQDGTWNSTGIQLAEGVSYHVIGYTGPNCTGSGSDTAGNAPIVIPAGFAQANYDFTPNFNG